MSSAALDIPARAMAFDGVHLWTLLSGGAVVRMDADTPAVLQTFDPVDPDVDWSGIASAGGDLFLVGRTRTAPSEGVLVRAHP